MQRSAIAIVCCHRRRSYIHARRYNPRQTGCCLPSLTNAKLNACNDTIQFHVLQTIVEVDAVVWFRIFVSISSHSIDWSSCNMWFVEYPPNTVSWKLQHCACYLECPTECLLDASPEQDPVPRIADTGEWKQITGHFIKNNQPHNIIWLANRVVQRIGCISSLWGLPVLDMLKTFNGD